MTGKTYLRWHLVHATAAELSTDFVNEDFNFYETTLRGTKQIKPRWKRVVASTDSSIGEALGKLYVADYFPPESKARMLEIWSTTCRIGVGRPDQDAGMDGRRDQGGSVEKTGGVHR